MEGTTHASRENTAPFAYLPDGNPGPYGGGTYNGTDTNQLQAEYENIFGPAARDIKFDPQRQKRHQRWHLPDVLKGPNTFLTDRVDGLITDTTNSPFTSVILPYVYLEHPDAKIKWNVWSFDEGLASRAPYESGARVLTQTKRSYAGYTVRQAIGIRMEHNFMRSPEGVVNFQRQLKQLVGSIQYGNDLDVHMALIQAPSHAQVHAEKYYSSKRNPTQLVRTYVDLFGIMQKNPNALDLLIEESKQELKNWGAQDPSFILLNGKLTMQLQMTPERTSYVTQGIDGLKRLRQGPNIDSYRGLSIIKSRAFSIETGALPRDVLRRRVRVAEYYRILPDSNNRGKSWEFYDQSKDSWFRLNYRDLVNMSRDDAGPRYENAPKYLGATPNQVNVQASVMSRSTSYPLNEWAQKPYNAKISLLPSLCTALIHGTDVAASTHECLVLPALYMEGEEVFAQTITQGANVMDMDEQSQAHIDASAWFGGGLFSDTTYHHLDEHRAAFPMCNWASLDARRCASDAPLNDQDRMDEFIYAVNNNSIAAIKNAIPDGDQWKRFVAYCPNAAGFSWENAHNGDNIAPTSEVVVAAAFANTKMSAATDRALWTQRPSVPDNIVCEMYRMMVPTIPYGANNNQILNGINQLHDNVKPWRTFLMIGLGAYFHPSPAVRASLKSDLDVMHPGLETGLMDYLHNYMDREQRTFADAGALFDTYFAPASTQGFVLGQTITDLSTDGINEDLPIQTMARNVDLSTFPPCRATGLFFLMAAKRMFCAAGRFKNGGGVDDVGNAGLSLLSRTFAGIGPRPAVTGIRPDVAPADVLPGGLVPLPNIPDQGQGVDPVSAAAAEHMEFVILRPNIEHNMLGVIMGRGGVDELGATFWGQTELNCFDDAEHGLWGMNYKYHERAQVLNEKNLIRVWDIAFDGYNGGMDDRHVDFTGNAPSASLTEFRNATNNINDAYTGPSMIVMAFYDRANAPKKTWPNPIVFADNVRDNAPLSATSADPENIHKVVDERMRVFNTERYRQAYLSYFRKLPDFAENSRLRKPAGMASAVDETQTATALAFQGHMRTYNAQGVMIEEVHGAGHLGPCYAGVASVREGKGYKPIGGPTLSRMV